MMLKIAFATCVQLGLSCIEQIYDMGGRFDLFITLKDERAKEKSGRVYLDETANKQGVPLLKIDNINDPEVLEALREHKIDWLFIIGWSQIARKDVLEAPTYGCIGIHPTLLPKGRGRAAIPWAILKGLDKTGVTMFRLDEGVDTGDIIGQVVVPLHEGITATELFSAVNEAHVTLIKKYWDDIIGNTITLTKQDNSQATEWPGRKPEDGEIFPSMTMEEAERLVRAVTHPYPGAFFRDGGKTTVIWACRTNKTEGTIKLKDGYMIPTDFEVK